VQTTDDNWWLAAAELKRGRAASQKNRHR
jgi:hypothetical protein